MEKPSCGKCGAGPANMELREEYLQAGTKEYVIRCVKCGDRMYLKPEPAKVRQQREKAAHAEVRATPKASGFEYRQCTFEGCVGTYAVVARTIFNLCPYHSEKIQNWRKGKMTTPPPYIQIGEKWTVNPERERKAS